MEAVGVRSFWIIIMAAIMIGAVFGLQFGNIFHLFGAESMVGAAASFAIAKVDTNKDVINAKIDNFLISLLYYHVIIENENYSQ